MNLPLAGILSLAALPWPLVAYALYHLHSYQWAFALYHGLCVLGAWRWGRGRWTSFRVPLRLLSFSVLMVPLAAVVVHLLVPAQAIVECLSRLGFSASHLPGFVAYFLLFQPAAEEAFWRGTIYEGLRGHLPESTAALLGACLFGGWHSLVIVLIAPSLWGLGTAAVIAFGAFMTWLYRTHGREVLPAAIVHSIAGDLPLMVVMALAVIPR